MKADDPAANCFIISFNANDVITLDGIEFIKCEVLGQSFMLHQIRKMMGFAVAIMRNCAPESLIKTAFSKDVNITVPMAPEVGLYLDECFFTSYNNTKYEDNHEEVSMEAYKEEAKTFKLKHIYSHIGSAEGQACFATDTLLQGQYLKDGQELVSAFNIFKLKFFIFENSSNLYLGIWYNDLYLNGNKQYAHIQDRAVWIANRNNPVPGRSGSLTRGNMYWASGLWFKDRFSLEEFNSYEFIFSYVSTESEHYFMFSVDRHYADTVSPTIMIDQEGILHINRLDRELTHVRCSPFTIGEVVDNECYRRDPRGCLNAGCLVPDMPSGFKNCSPSGYNYEHTLASNSIDSVSR
ncbi:hypothetical protein Bca52824_017457 [Brassica carinata]|uniref:tRNA pseudouridine synthase n=1 Tax=Brassica carinata TaxID=52824 RepID=A0A8X8AWA5_BRACI|nr:hypothetical protein Bca52824_017457 [Brassica carinata]